MEFDCTAALSLLTSTNDMRLAIICSSSRIPFANRWILSLGLPKHLKHLSSIPNLFANIEKSNSNHHLFVENKSSLKMPALSLSISTPVGNIGEIITVVSGDSRPMRSILCINNSNDFWTSSGPLHLTLLRLLIPTCIHILVYPIHTLGSISSIV